MAANQQTAEPIITQKRPSASSIMSAAKVPITTGSWYTNSETNIYFNSDMIFDLHDQIAKDINPDAAVQYTNMVAGLYIIEQDLRPPRFIDSVYALEEADWVYQGPHKNEKYYDLAKTIGMSAALMTEMQLADQSRKEVTEARNEKAGMLWKYHKELTEPYRTLFHMHTELRFPHMMEHLTK